MSTIENCRDDFLMFENNKNLIYFDSAATSFKPKIVLDEINNFYNKQTCNIHRGDYDLSYKVSKAFDETRVEVANFINARMEKEIIFTSGASESLNMVALLLGQNYFQEGDVILTSKVEHASNILPWFVLAKKKHLKIEYVPLNKDGTFNLEAYENCFKTINNIKLVSLTMVSNVLGYLYPIKEICKIAHLNNALVNIDGAQGVPHLKVDVQALDLDFLSFSAHKMLGPSGIGVLYGKYELLEKFEPIFYGGGANARFNSDGSIILKDIPERFEAGTPNIEAILGFKKAIAYLKEIGMDKIEEYDQELTKYFIAQLSQLNHIEIYNKDSNVGIISFNVKGIFAQDVAAYLNSKNICVRSGNHCAKILHEIIGVNETIRASLYLYNNKKEIDYFLDILKDISLEKCVEAIL